MVDNHVQGSHTWQYGSICWFMCEPIWVKLMVIELSFEFFMKWTEWSKGGRLTHWNIFCSGTLGHSEEMDLFITDICCNLATSKNCNVST